MAVYCIQWPTPLPLPPGEAGRPTRVVEWAEEEERGDEEEEEESGNAEQSSCREERRNTEARFKCSKNTYKKSTISSEFTVLKGKIIYFHL